MTALTSADAASHYRAKHCPRQPNSPRVVLAGFKNPPTSHFDSGVYANGVAFSISSVIKSPLDTIAH